MGFPQHQAKSSRIVLPHYPLCFSSSCPKPQGTTVPLWKQPISLAILADISRGTAVEHLGIEFLELGEDFLRGGCQWMRARASPTACSTAG